MVSDLSHSLRMGYAVIKNKLLKKKRILSVQIMLNYTCNLKCIYCSAPRSKEVINFDKLTAILRYLKKEGTQQISFAGGEPTIHPDYDKIVRSAKQRGFYVTVSTNAYDPAPLLSAERDGLPHLVSVSLDGSEKVHDLCRGKGTHQKALASLRAFKERRIPRAINAVIGKHNGTIENMKWLFATADSLGANFSFQWMLPNFNTQGESGDFVIPIPQMKRLLRDVLTIRRRNRRRLIFGDGILEELLTWDSLDPAYRAYPGKRCFAGSYFAFISPSGKLAPCSLLEFHPWYAANDLFTIGFDTAFETIKKIPCNDCYLGCNMLRNNIFSLNPRTLKSVIRMVSKT